MQCDQARELIWPDHDGELNGQQASDLHVHMQSCTACTAQWHETAGLRIQLGRGVASDEAVSVEVETLWNKVRRSFDEYDATQGQTIHAAPAQLSGRRSFLISGAVAASVVAGVTGYSRFFAESPDVVTEAVTDFLTFRAGGMTLNVIDNSPEPLKRWLTERVDFDIAISAAPPEGFRLVGGRLCSFLNRRLVFIYYEKAGSGVSLYLMNDRGLSVPDSNLVKVGERQVSASTIDGVAAATWAADGLVFAAVSDLPQKELLEFLSMI
ncbi:MAG: zf-HC2 domain-containing protein [Burkholderiaceae bacterium]